MKIEHHKLDIYPVPIEKTPIYINEPWLIDGSISFELRQPPEIDDAEDNIRIYVPLDLNKKAILRRLDEIIYRYGESSERNESSFSYEVRILFNQVEIYDQIWYARKTPMDSKHSAEAIELVKEFVERLENIPDACSEIFPFAMIDELNEEYLGIEPEFKHEFPYYDF